MDTISFISAVGLGALLSIPLQYFFNERAKRKTILFQETKEAFIGLMTAYRNAAIKQSDANAKEFAYWQMRCNLICSNKVRDAIKNIIETNEDRDARLRAQEEMERSLSGELRKHL